MRAHFLRPPETLWEWVADGIRVIGLLSVIAAFAWWTVTDAGILALALPALLVPRLLGSTAGFDVVYGVTVLVAAWSNVIDLYRSVAWWDILVHVVATGLIAAALHLAFQRFRIAPGPDAPGRATVVLVTIIGLAISAVWEMIEWLGKTFLAPDIFVTYQDTIGDMAVGGLGSLLVGILLTRITIDRAATSAADRKESTWQT